MDSNTVLTKFIRLKKLNSQRSVRMTLNLSINIDAYKMHVAVAATGVLGIVEKERSLRSESLWPQSCASSK